MALEIAFDLTLDHGRCLGIRIPDGEALDRLIETRLVPEEQAIALALPPPRRRTWTGGRVAIRELLRRASVPAPAILADDRGAPVVPPGLAGSITHKDSLAAALIALESRAKVGVDLELDVVRSLDLSSRVLAPDEIAELAGLDAVARGREVLLRFSAKEAIYKALDPFVRRYVSFDEMSVSTAEDGTALVTPHLRAAEGPFVVEVRWLRFDGVVLTTARAAPR